MLLSTTNNKSHVWELQWSLTVALDLNFSEFERSSFIAIRFSSPDINLKNYM